MPFTAQNGLFGVAEIRGVAFLATGGSVELTHEAIFSSGVYGAGWYDAATQVAYAFNSVKIEGTVDFELTAGTMIAALKQYAFEDRGNANGHSIKILPNGTNGFDGVGWCSTVSFNASEGAVVTGSIGFSSDNVDGLVLTGSPVNQKNKFGNFTGFGATLYPYWNTYITGLPFTEIIDWSADYNSTVNFLTLCKERTVFPVPSPDYILIGTMEASGSITAFGTTALTAAELQDESTNVVIHMSDSDGNNAHTIEFASVLFNSDSLSMTTGGEYTTASLSFTATGDGSQPPMNLV